VLSSGRKAVLLGKVPLVVVRLDLRRLVLASWPVDPGAAARALPPGLRPALVDGESLVSVVGFRCVGGTVGRLPVVPFSQLNVRLYAEHDGEPAVFFLRSLVTAGGLPGFLIGAPYRLAWIRVREGEVSAPSQGLRIRYRVGLAEATPGLLGRHELGIFEERGVRAFRVERGPADWRHAEAVGAPRVDLLRALGFDVQGEPRVAYAPEASFESEAPPRRLALPAAQARSSARRARR
jgi:uncharacterized protein YqjF (DUF2071 family)